jgi:hypothetical protein
MENGELPQAGQPAMAGAADPCILGSFCYCNKEQIGQ